MTTDENELEKSLQLRLANQPAHVSMAISHRAIMRIAPLFWLELVDRLREYPEVQELWSKRALLASAAVVGARSRESVFASVAAADQSSSLPTDVLFSIHAQAESANNINSASGAAHNAGVIAKEAADFAASNTREMSRNGGFAAIWGAVNEDCERNERGEDVLSAPLWTTIPGEFSAAWQRIRDVWASRPEQSANFWISWYEDALAGRRPDWQFLQDVAQLPNEVWNAGRTAVAEAIATIEERYRLRAEVAALKEQLQKLQAESNAASASPQHRSHNHPPELIEAEAEARRDVADLVVTLEAAEKELSKTAPSPSILRRVGTTIFNVTKRIVLYSGGLVDIAVKKAAEEVGTTGARWAIGLGLFYCLEPLRALANALLEFAQRLPWP